MAPVASVPSRSLLLNASREPLCLVTVRRAVVLVLSGKAIVLESDDRVLHSENANIPLPLVTVLTRYVHVPYRAVGSPTRRTVLYRDGFRCCYCGSTASTIDHVIPRSRGGVHDWTNVVAACVSCNHRKADHLLGEIGWHLTSQPTAPSTRIPMPGGIRRMEPVWSTYLDPVREAKESTDNSLISLHAAV